MFIHNVHELAQEVIKVLKAVKNFRVLYYLSSVVLVTQPYFYFSRQRPSFGRYFTNKTRIQWHCELSYLHKSMGLWQVDM
jgi:hypothetical protein